MVSLEMGIGITPFLSHHAVLAFYIYSAGAVKKDGWHCYS